MCRKSVKPIQRGVNLLIGVNELGTQSRVRSLYNLWPNLRPQFANDDESHINIYDRTYETNIAIISAIRSYSVTNSK